MKQTKHLLATIAMLLCGLAASAEIVQSGTCGDNLIYTLDDNGELVIEGTGRMYYYLSSHHVPWSVYTQSIKKVTIKEGVTSIGENAFYGCSSLTSITLPESVITIGENAFESCTNLTSFTIPENSKLTSIGKSAFSRCERLTSITIPEGVTSIGYYAFSSCSSLSSITIPENSQLTSIGMDAFSSCSSLTSITIPESVTSIGSSAFNGCSSLTSVHISSIEAWCNISFGFFSGSNPLSYAHDLYLDGKLVTKLNIPEGVTSIGRYAFHTCENLTSVTLPESVTSIGENAFESCTNLTSFTIPENSKLTSIGKSAFSRCERLTSITIPENVTSIGEAAFYRCKRLTNVDVHIASVESWITNNFASSLDYSYSLYLDGDLLNNVEIPSSVASIPNHAFYNCNSIVSVTIPDNVTMIGESAFQNCSALTIAILPKSLSMIKKNAFYGCSNLKNIVIPESVESIYSEAFAKCTALKSIKVLATEPPFAHDNTFPNYNVELCVPEETMETYRTTAPWSNFTKIRNLEGEEVEVKQCAVPTIDYIDGKVVLTCETEGVTFKSSITAEDARNYDEAAYTLAATYTITAYATKKDYLDSETTTVTLCWIECSEEHDEKDGIINIASHPVLIQTNNGVITLTGLAEGTAVTVYDLGGTQQGTATATNGTATITTSLTAGTIVIVKIGEHSIKVAIR